MRAALGEAAPAAGGGRSTCRETQRGSCSGNGEGKLGKAGYDEAGEGGFLLFGGPGSQHAINPLPSVIHRSPNMSHFLYLRGRDEEMPPADIERMMRRWFMMSRDLPAGRRGSNSATSSGSSPDGSTGSARARSEPRARTTTRDNGRDRNRLEIPNGLSSQGLRRRKPDSGRDDARGPGRALRRARGRVFSSGHNIGYRR